MNYISAYNWGKKRFDICILIAIHVLAICTACLVIFIFFFNENNKTVMNAKFSAGIYNSAVMDECEILSYPEDEIDYTDYLVEMLRSIYDTPEVTAIGGFGYYCSNLNIWKPLEVIQKKHTCMQENLEEGRVEELYMDYTLVHLMELDVVEGMDFEEAAEYVDEDTTIIYLGSFLREAYPVGTVLEYVKGDYVQKFFIAGVLEEGSSWIPKTLLMSPDVSLLEDTSIVCLDNLMIELCRKGTVGGSFYISYAENVSQEDVKEAVMKCVKEYNAEATIHPLGEIVSKNAKSYDIVFKYLLAVALMVGVMEIIIVICMRLGAFFTERRQYGIMLASGGLKNEITQSIFGDNVLVGGFACFIGNTIIAAIIGFMVKTTKKHLLLNCMMTLFFRE